MSQQVVRHVTPFRHAVELMVGIERNLDWLHQQIVKLTASGVWGRYTRLRTMIDIKHTSAVPALERMKKTSQLHGFEVNTFESFLDGVELHNTYLSTGAGAISFPRRVERVRKLIKRVRNMTLGSDRIDWFLEALSRELSRHLPDHLRVASWLEDVSPEDGDPYEAIVFTIVQVSEPVTIES